jgi:hypothetical protein
MFNSILGTRVPGGDVTISEAGDSEEFEDRGEQHLGELMADVVCTVKLLVREVLDDVVVVWYNVDLFISIAYTSPDLNPRSLDLKSIAYRDAVDDG